MTATSSSAVTASSAEQVFAGELQQLHAEGTRRRLQPLCDAVQKTQLQIAAHGHSPDMWHAFVIGGETLRGSRIGTQCIANVGKLAAMGLFPLASIEFACHMLRKVLTTSTAMLVAPSGTSGPSQTQKGSGGATHVADADNDVALRVVQTASHLASLCGAQVRFMEPCLSLLFQVYLGCASGRQPTDVLAATTAAIHTATSTVLASLDGIPPPDADRLAHHLAAVAFLRDVCAIVIGQPTRWVKLHQGPYAAATGNGGHGTVTSASATSSAASAAAGGNQAWEAAMSSLRLLLLHALHERWSSAFLPTSDPPPSLVATTSPLSPTAPTFELASELSLCLNEDVLQVVLAHSKYQDDAELFSKTQRLCVNFLSVNGHLLRPPIFTALVNHHARLIDAASMPCPRAADQAGHAQAGLVVATLWRRLFAGPGGPPFVQLLLQMEQRQQGGVVPPESPTTSCSTIGRLSLPGSSAMHLLLAGAELLCHALTFPKHHHPLEGGRPVVPTSSNQSLASPEQSSSSFAVATSSGMPVMYHSSDSSPTPAPPTFPAHTGGVEHAAGPRRLTSPLAPGAPWMSVDVLSVSIELNAAIAQSLLRLLEANQNDPPGDLTRAPPRRSETACFAAVLDSVIPTSCRALSMVVASIAPLLRAVGGGRHAALHGGDLVLASSASPPGGSGTTITAGGEELLHMVAKWATQLVNCSCTARASAHFHVAFDTLASPIYAACATYRDVAVRLSTDDGGGRDSAPAGNASSLAATAGAGSFDSRALRDPAAATTAGTTFISAAVPTTASLHSVPPPLPLQVLCCKAVIGLLHTRFHDVRAIGGWPPVLDALVTFVSLHGATSSSHDGVPHASGSATNNHSAAAPSPCWWFAQRTQLVLRTLRRSNHWPQEGAAAGVVAAAAVDAVATIVSKELASTTDPNVLWIGDLVGAIVASGLQPSEQHEPSSPATATGQPPNRILDGTTTPNRYGMELRSNAWHDWGPATSPLGPASHPVATTALPRAARNGVDGSYDAVTCRVNSLGPGGEQRVLDTVLTFVARSIQQASSGDQRNAMLVAVATAIRPVAHLLLSEPSPLNASSRPWRPALVAATLVPAVGRMLDRGLSAAGADGSSDDTTTESARRSDGLVSMLQLLYLILDLTNAPPPSAGSDARGKLLEVRVAVLKEAQKCVVHHGGAREECRSQQRDGALPRRRLHRDAWCLLLLIARHSISEPTGPLSCDANAAESSRSQRSPPMAADAEHPALPRSTASSSATAATNLAILTIAYRLVELVYQTYFSSSTTAVQLEESEAATLAGGGAAATEASSTTSPAKNLAGGGHSARSAAGTGDALPAADDHEVTLQTIEAVATFMLQRCRAGPTGGGGEERVNINLSAVQLAWTVADHVASSMSANAAVGRSAAIHHTPSRASADGTDSDPRGAETWTKLLSALLAASVDDRAEIRLSALRTLFSILVAHGGTFSDAAWHACLWGLATTVIDRTEWLVGNAATAASSSSEPALPGQERTAAAGAVASPWNASHVKALDEYRGTLFEGCGRVLRLYGDILVRHVPDASSAVLKIVAGFSAALDAPSTEMAITAAMKALCAVVVDASAAGSTSSGTLINDRVMAACWETYAKLGRLAAAPPPAGKLGQPIPITLSVLKVVVDAAGECVIRMAATASLHAASEGATPLGSGATGTTPSGTLGATVHVYTMKFLNLLKVVLSAHSITTAYMFPAPAQVAAMTALEKIWSHPALALSGGGGGGSHLPSAAADDFWLETLTMLLSQLPSKDQVDEAIVSGAVSGTPSLRCWGKRPHPQYVASIASFLTRALQVASSSGSAAASWKLAPAISEAAGRLLLLSTTLPAASVESLGPILEEAHRLLIVSVDVSLSHMVSQPLSMHHGDTRRGSDESGNNIVAAVGRNTATSAVVYCYPIAAHLAAVLASLTQHLESLAQTNFRHDLLFDEKVQPLYLWQCIGGAAVKVVLQCVDNAVALHSMLSAFDAPPAGASPAADAATMTVRPAGEAVLPQGKDGPLRDALSLLEALGDLHVVFSCCRSLASSLANHAVPPWRDPRFVAAHHGNVPVAIQMGSFLPPSSPPPKASRADNLRQRRADTMDALLTAARLSYWDAVCRCVAEVSPSSVTVATVNGSVTEAAGGCNSPSAALAQRTSHRFDWTRVKHAACEAVSQATAEITTCQRDAARTSLDSLPAVAPRPVLTAGQAYAYLTEPTLAKRGDPILQAPGAACRQAFARSRTVLAFARLISLPDADVRLLVQRFMIATALA